MKIQLHCLLTKPFNLVIKFKMQDIDLREDRHFQAKRKERC